jgi:hypothetical protein
MWIINVMDNTNIFFDEFKNIKSPYEKYYIIMKYVQDIDYELEFKRFTIFKKDSKSHIIYESMLI